MSDQQAKVEKEEGSLACSGGLRPGGPGGPDSGGPKSGGPGGPDSCGPGGPDSGGPKSGSQNF